MWVKECYFILKFSLPVGFDILKKALHIVVKIIPALEVTKNVLKNINNNKHVSE